MKKEKLLDTNLKRNLSRLIEQQGWDMKNLSLKAGLGETYITDILAGRVRNPTIGKLHQIAIKLKTTVDALHQPPENNIKGYIIQGLQVELQNDLLTIDQQPMVDLIGEYEFLDNSNAPLAYQGWRYKIHNLRTPENDFSDRSPYWVMLEDKSIWIRKIRHSHEKGKYHLIHSITAEITENVSILYIAEIAIFPKY